MIKATCFHRLARATIQNFSKEVRMELGKAIFDLQKGELLSMPLSRPMPSVAPGVSELRVKDKAGIYRVFYYMKSKKKIFIFHAFVKKTQQTPNHEIFIGQKRLKEMIENEKE